VIRALVLLVAMVPGFCLASEEMTASHWRETKSGGDAAVEKLNGETRLVSGDISHIGRMPEGRISAMLTVFFQAGSKSEKVVIPIVLEKTGKDKILKGRFQVEVKFSTVRFTEELKPGYKRPESLGSRTRSMSIGNIQSAIQNSLGEGEDEVMRDARRNGMTIKVKHVGYFPSNAKLIKKLH
jgi:hypothetical protein